MSKTYLYLWVCESVPLHQHDLVGFGSLLFGLSSPCSFFALPEWGS